MNLPICVKCCKRLRKFNVLIERNQEDVDGKDLCYDWARVFCPTCDSEVWCEDLEAASLADYDKAIRRINK